MIRSEIGTQKFEPFFRFWPIGLENRVGLRVRFLLQCGKYLYAVYLDEAFL